MCLCVCVCVYAHMLMHVVPTEARRGYWIPRTGVTEAVSHWELNQELLQEQKVLLITDPSL